MNGRVHILLGLSLALASCHPGARRTLTQAQALLQDRPDSALTLLQTLSEDSLKDKERAKYALSYITELYHECTSPLFCVEPIATLSRAVCTDSG